MSLLAFARSRLVDRARTFVRPLRFPEVVVSTIAARAAGAAGTSPLGAGPNPPIADLLADVRARTETLVAPLTDGDVRRQHDPLMSPIVWDLGHIAAFEELWLVRQLERPHDDLAFGEMPGLFNPFEHPRRERGALPLPGRTEALAVLAEIRERALDRLARTDIGPGAAPIARDGYVYRMVAQHEAQHGETMLQTLQLKRGDPYRPLARAPFPAEAGQPPSAFVGRMVSFPGGTVRVGTDDRRAAYDNERPVHELELPPFLIDAAPVTNAEYLEFIRDGGYRTPEWWSPAGRAWRAEAAASAPKYWFRFDGEWWTRTMDRTGPIDATHPVVHVSFFEAEAYARWAGKRLPSEIEWEAAASWDPAAAGGRRAFPWGDAPPTPALANLDQVTFGTAPVGCYGDNVSPIGCYGMIGDVWEWTASDFGPYPGFVSFPYREYSEVFFGTEYKVLRGGSWATRAIAARSTFRNWDYPSRRQIFSGFRCARDV